MSFWFGGPVEKELSAIFQNKNEPQREDEVQTVFVDHRPNPIANERMRRGVFEAFGNHVSLGGENLQFYKNIGGNQGKLRGQTNIHYEIF